MAAVVVIGGVPRCQVMPPVRVMRDVSTVVAADSGWDLAVSLGVGVDVLVGDLDSISEAGLAAAEAGAVEIHRHQRDKDATDFELALELACDRGHDRIVVIGGEGGRLDHLLANAAIMASPSFASARIDAFVGDAYVAPVRRRWSASMPAGAQLSVLAWAGDATVTERGVRWPLQQRHLRAGTSLGLSNEALGGEVEIEVDEGLVLVVVPDAKELT